MVTTRDLAEERLTVAQAAVRLGVSKSSVYRYVREGRLRPTREREGLLFNGLDLEILLGYRSFGRNGPPVWSDEQLAAYLAEDAIELPAELRHLITA